LPPEYFRNQLRELLTNHGTVDEVWFDGACGEGPNGKRQEYDWSSYYALIRQLQPNALIAISGPDVRWVGNESGVARENESSVVTRDGRLVWHPAECDVPECRRLARWMVTFEATDRNRGPRSLAHFQSPAATLPWPRSHPASTKR